MLSQHQLRPPISERIRQLAGTLRFVAAAYICALPSEVERTAVRAWLCLVLGRGNPLRKKAARPRAAKKISP